MDLPATRSETIVEHSTYPTIIEMMQAQGMREGSFVHITLPAPAIATPQTREELSRFAYFDDGWRDGAIGRNTPGYRPFWPGTTDVASERISGLRVSGIVEKIEDKRVTLSLYQGTPSTALKTTIPPHVYVHQNAIADFSGEGIRMSRHERWMRFLESADRIAALYLEGKRMRAEYGLE